MVQRMSDTALEVLCQTCGIVFTAPTHFWSLPNFPRMARTIHCDLSIIHPHHNLQVQRAAEMASRHQVFVSGQVIKSKNGFQMDTLNISAKRFPFRMNKQNDRQNTWDTIDDKSGYKRAKLWASWGLYVIDGVVKCVWCNNPPSLDTLFPPHQVQHNCMVVGSRRHLRQIEIKGTGVIYVIKHAALIQAISSLSRAQIADVNRCLSSSSSLFPYDTRLLVDSGLLYTGYLDLCVCVKCFCICAGLSCQESPSHECITDLFKKLKTDQLDHAIRLGAYKLHILIRGEEDHNVVRDNESHLLIANTKSSNKRMLDSTIKLPDFHDLILNTKWVYQPSPLSLVIKTPTPSPHWLTTSHHTLKSLTDFINVLTSIDSR